MEIRRFYLGCLAHASYLVEDSGEAAVVDPQRDVDLYIEEARNNGLTIRWVIETHLHADFVSGHLELARRTGATICIGTGSGAAFPHRALADGDELPLGHGVLRVIATPGHTEEGISILAIPPAILAESPAAPLAVFTGDTLFIGDVGRPDLSPTRTPQQLASMLYDSLRLKLMALPDETLVYPAHGAGSLCGRQMSSESSSTIGKERRMNYALQPMSREQFVDLLTADLPARPAYFQDEVQRNRSGAPDLDELAALRSLTPAEALQLQTTGAVILDTRPTMEFAAVHVPGSLHIPLNGQFASWAARLLGIEGVTVVLLAEDEAGTQESRLRLARVGIENVAGVVAGGIYGWIDAGLPVKSINQISAQELAEQLESPSSPVMVIDVRERAERLAGSIAGSLSIPLPELSRRLDEIDRGSMLFVHCKSGYRSAIATSILQAAGFDPVVNLSGGFDAWALSFPTPAVGQTPLRAEAESQALK
jgi:glyoxylase-like metal-dependent hydrolase (beta-lactamase superfamily II)/rhodanese-related sulfurtransferase